MFFNFLWIYNVVIIKNQSINHFLLTIVVCNLLTPSLQIAYDSRMQHKKVVIILKLVLKCCDFHTIFGEKIVQNGGHQQWDERKRNWFASCPKCDQWHRQLDNWGGANIHIFVFCIINLFWNRLFLWSVHEHKYMNIRPLNYRAGGATECDQDKVK